MSYEATVVCLKNIRPHPNADKVNLVTIFGNQVVIGKNYTEGQKGLFFEVGTKLSHNFCKYNNLYSNSLENFDTNTKGYFDKNGKVRAQNFRGEKSEGFFLPIECLWYVVEETGVKEENLYSLPEGTSFKDINGEIICEKYTNPNENKKSHTTAKKAVLKEMLPYFKEHFDTEQFFREIPKISDKLKENYLFYITEKLHGTSCRVGNTKVFVKPKWWEFWKKPASKYEFVVGSRKVIKSIRDITISSGGYYGDFDIWTESSKVFRDNLMKGETIYYEIVGYLPNRTPVMGEYSNEKLKNLLSKENYNEIIEKYGNSTIFSYGCNPGNFDIYVYRISITTDDGYEIDLSWEQVKSRCKTLGVKHVPELYKNTTDVDLSNISDKISYFTDIASFNFPQHIKEGVCIRIETGNKQPIILKNKSFIYKVLEGIITEQNNDLEETQK